MSKQKNSKRSVFLAVACGVFVAAFAVSALTVLNKNNKCIREYTPREPLSPYEKRVPITAIDYSSDFNKAFEIVTSPVAYSVPERIKLPIRIQYFKAIDDEAPVVDFPAGTEVQVTKPLTIPSIAARGYGLSTYPTYDAGWRYAAPFIQGEQMDPATKYFVRTADIETVWRAFMKQSKTIMATTNIFNRRETLHHYVRFIDYRFYECGVFCSPALLRSIWSPLNIGLLVGALGLFIALAVNLWITKRRRGSAVQQQKD